jgi:hypothetical protein
MRVRLRAWRVLFWGGLLVACSLAGGLWWAYSYYTNSDTLARLVKCEAPRYLPGALLDVGRVRVRPFGGEINLTNVGVRQVLDGSGFLAARIPWLNVRHDAQAMLEGRFVPQEVVVTHPTLRLRRRKDGTWNLQGLLADPWPGPTLKGMPPILVQNGTVELADGPTAAEGVAILRDVAVKVESAGDDQVRFEGTAKGDAFDRLGLEGTFDRSTGRVTLRGDVTRLVISQTLRKRIPPELRPRVEALGLTAGEVDLRLARLTYDPAASPAVRYEMSAKVRSGLWACPKLPFPINDLSASLAVRDGVLTIERAEGYNGLTTVRADGQISLGDPARAPLRLHLDLRDLELDDRLHRWTPREHLGLWDEFHPSGRVSVAVDATRDRAGGPLALAVGVDCLDVSMVYKYFKYPLDHVWGRVDWTPQQATLKLHSVVGDKPITASGTIDNPGPLGHARLDFEAGAVPVDQALLKAMPPDVRQVIDGFRPSGSVRGRAHVERTPPAGPRDDPRGKVAVDATLDLNERCSITWVGLPYPVENLTGRLELHPDRWEFQGMRGTHGQASITGQGKVEKVAGGLKVGLRLSGQRLLFDDELRQSLPPAWRKTWATLNPIGSSDVDATIKAEPGKPDDYHLEITPGPATGVRLQYSRAPRPGVDPGGQFKLPMDDVRGRFVYDNGIVRMSDVGFQFHDAQVRFGGGWVRVEDSGRFQLYVADLYAKDIRLDAKLREIMPPVMAQFARRLDDGRTFALKGNLWMSWSGQPGAPVLCGWNHGLVVLNDNSIQAGVPLSHLQGQVDSVRGQSDGEHLEVHGAVVLESVSLLGQQVTRVESPLDVEQGWARLDDIRGTLLGGKITGRFRVSLDTTPRYLASVALEGADLQRYARTISGRQTFRGLVDARLDLEGLGTDLHTLQGGGEAHVTRGDLGELPVLLRLFKILNLSPATKTAFDSADVAFSIRNGESYVDPIKFTGDAFSLMGRGTLDAQGALDLRLRVLYGRDKVHLLVLSDALREASGQFFVVRVLGTPSYPNLKLEALPALSDFGRSIAKRRPPRAEHETR